MCCSLMVLLIHATRIPFDFYAVCNNPPQSKLLCLVHWIPPDVEFYKVNTDTAVAAKNFKIVLGVVVRNRHNQMMLSNSCPVEEGFDSKTS
ncbi:hypothetical protein ACOSP7_016338 [Xanthoceras sorbifolium]